MSKRKLSTFERLSQGKMNRKQRKELTRRLYSDDPGLEVVHRNVAGIDVGNESHFVAVAPGCDSPAVREFGSWTADLMRMAEWLKSCGVKMVVMQSTGVYWIAVYEVLEKAGFQVWLTNARDTKKPAGAKERCAREPVVVKAADVRIVAQLVSPAGGDSAAANGVAVTEPARAGGRACHPAYAKGPDHHERAIGQYPERRQWGHRAGHHSHHSERRARPLSVGAA